MKKLLAANMLHLSKYLLPEILYKKSVKKGLKEPDNYLLLPDRVKHAITAFELHATTSSRNQGLMLKDVVKLEGTNSLYGLLNSKSEEMFAAIYHDESGFSLTAIFSNKGRLINFAC